MKKFIEKMRNVKIKDILHLFIFSLVFIPAKIYKVRLSLSNNVMWLIAENEYDARDNGYVLFKYIRENYESKNVYYAINSNSPDYEKVFKLGNVISYGTVKHWFYYLSSDINISSQKGGKPNAAVCYLLEVYGVLKNKRVFLQHGITMNKVEWLYYKNTKLKLFICGSYPEYLYVKKEFGYPENSVQYLGFSRFDNLHNKQSDKKKIVFMPSWRNWLVLNNVASDKYYSDKNFLKTEYFTRINELLSDKRLHSILDKNNISMYFYPHREMQGFIDYFDNYHDSIKVVSSSNIDIQELLIDTSLMITDYSSVSMDFGYMKKPVIYYQFDVETFRENQYEEGYFSYEDDGFGPVVFDSDSVVNSIERYIQNDYEVNIKQELNHNKAFKLFDTENSERIFKAIEELE